ncbi:MAG: universal stress protein [Bacteroidetes bacterium]|nr:universal stress protein [Bacteroidota bacterium]
MKKIKSTKTILVGIDYTKSSDNALNYAALLAKRNKASIMLFHIYETPVIHTYSGAYFISYKEMQGFNMARLNKYKSKVEEKHPGITFETFSTYKSFKAGVSDLIKSRKVHYVVLGLESKSKFSKFIYGTTGLEVAGKISCPVIIVPERYKDHRLNKMVLAIDNQKTLETKLMQKVKDFSKNFKADLSALHVKTENEFMLIPHKKSENANKKWKVNTVEAKDFESGLFAYVKSNKVDLITLISHSHSLMYNLFNESNTKQIAFKTKVPIMSIHD